MTWQLFTLISVISLSISVILQRVLIHKDKTDPFAYAVLFQGIVGVILMAFALIYGFKLPNIETVIVPAIISVLFDHSLFMISLVMVNRNIFDMGSIVITHRAISDRI